MEFRKHSSGLAIGTPIAIYRRHEGSMTIGTFTRQFRGGTSLPYIDIALKYIVGKHRLVDMQGVCKYKEFKTKTKKNQDCLWQFDKMFILTDEEYKEAQLKIVMETV